ncbi:MAG: hypothetical protein KJO79_04705 [Verrucomicrobiae bacterium]|nr:hypothetical protein [Verrucomicrobiae bacterium]NNJ86457.1 hypothetical protein [Akkermansiaceae bacterium]
MKLFQIPLVTRMIAMSALGFIIQSNIQAQTVPQPSAEKDDSSVLVDLVDRDDSKPISSKKDETPSVKATGDTVEPSHAGEKPDSSIPPVSSDQSVVEPAAMQKTADEGIQIQVEKATTISGPVNQSGVVKVYSPWPAKPIAPAPPGWKFVAAPVGLKPYKTNIKLGSGDTVDLSITPFVLVPISDGLNAIRISEPGYDPAQQYAQQDTVGTMLQKSTTELEENEKQAADAISRLQQLLSSLPQS